MDFVYHMFRPGLCGSSPWAVKLKVGRKLTINFCLYALAKCKVIITFNQGLRGGRVVELKKIVDEAVKHCPTIQHVLVAHRTDNKVHMGHRDIPLEQVCLLCSVQLEEEG